MALQFSYCLDPGQPKPHLFLIRNWQWSEWRDNSTEIMRWCGEQFDRRIAAEHRGEISPGEKFFENDRWGYQPGLKGFAFRDELDAFNFKMRWC